MTRIRSRVLLASMFALLADGALAQAAGGPAQATPSLYLTPIGPPIAVETARKAAAGAVAEARRNGWLMAVAVVDPYGTLVYYEKMDNALVASARLAVEKAVSAAIFKRPTKMLQDAVAGGGAGLRVLKYEAAMPVEGGLPLMQGGKLVGAIGLSGDASENDGRCAAAGVAAIAEK